MRNFFQGVPKDLEESARIDGANNIRILFSIYLPVSLAVIATITLWIMVGHWNSWFDATIYINQAELYPLQVVLRRILLEGTQQLMDINPNLTNDSQAASPDNIKAATIFGVHAAHHVPVSLPAKVFREGNAGGRDQGIDAKQLGGNGRGR